MRAVAGNTAWTRAVLPLCLLGLLDAEGESYGYALLGRLGDAGLTPVKPATLYPALARLEEEGAVDVEWRAGDGGPGRKYYRITAAGRARLDGDAAAWDGLARAVSALLGDRDTGGGEAPRR